MKAGFFFPVAVLLVAAVPLSVSAQQGRAAGPGHGTVRPAGPAGRQGRAVLERQLRQRTGELVRRQLQLNDDQMSRLQLVNGDFERQRTALMGQERRARQALRAELKNANPPDQRKVAGLLDELLSLQRQRLDLLANEQRELGKFLTPVQRAKYLGIQSQLHRRTQQLRDRRPPAGAAQDSPSFEPSRPRPGPRRNLR